jgi:putative MATE family efflux protein
MFAMFATSAAEVWFIGQLGTSALAGLALVFPMVMLVQMVSAGAMGGTVAGAVAQALGRQDRIAAATLAAHAIALALLMALVFAAFYLVFATKIYTALGGTGAVLAAALAYSDVVFAGCLSIWLLNILSSIVRACGQMRVAAIGTVGSSVLQVILAAVLVFGLGPLPAQGMAGAALALVLGLGTGAIFLAYWLLTGRAGIRLRLSEFRFDARVFIPLLKTALIASVSPASTVATVLVMTALVARLGPAALAGYGIGSRLEFLLVPVIFGIGAALITLVGVHFGAAKFRRGYRIAWTGSLAAAAICGLVGVTLAFVPQLWAHQFTEVEEVREICRLYLRIAGPGYAFFGLGLCLYFASQGAGHILWPVLGALLRLVIIAGGGLAMFAMDRASPEILFTLVAVGMTAYGLLTAGAIWLGAWGPRERV